MCEGAWHRSNFTVGVEFLLIEKVAWHRWLHKYIKELTKSTLHRNFQQSVDANNSQKHRMQSQTLHPLKEE